jgi:hypothetical protein
MVVGGDKLFAACTDGRIYTVSCSDFLQTSYSGTGHPNIPLYHDEQRGNTLYARLALHDDDRTLALGCNSGVITLWDTQAASLALGELHSQMGTSTGKGEAERHHYSSQLAMAEPAVLRGGHRNL